LTEGDRPSTSGALPLLRHTDSDDASGGLDVDKGAELALYGRDGKIYKGRHDSNVRFESAAAAGGGRFRVRYTDARRIGRQQRPAPPTSPGIGGNNGGGGGSGGARARSTTPQGTLAGGDAQRVAYAADAPLYAANDGAAAAAAAAADAMRPGTAPAATSTSSHGLALTGNRGDLSASLGGNNEGTLVAAGGGVVASTIQAADAAVAAALSVSSQLRPSEVAPVSEADQHQTRVPVPQSLATSSAATSVPSVPGSYINAGPGNDFAPTGLPPPVI
jgi:hypothetical protein